MVFKRRDRRPFWKIVADFLWPRGGWGRAFRYVKHRLHRLPGSPETIARGIWAGVFTTFTPFYGLHFFISAFLAWVMRGNIVAALLATFFGNPLTYVPIGVIALKTGHLILGTEFEDGAERSLVGKFLGAGEDLRRNLWASFTDGDTDWHSLSIFYEEVFLPYLVGGILPGIVAATICYYLSVPVIRAYQKRRAGKIMQKLKSLKKAAKRASEDSGGAE
ncbi:MAG: DUF2062 domain-containing protein [Paracoccaceae bacterium]